MRKSTPPSIEETAFDCPHCGALTTQFWFRLRAEQFSDDKHRLPFIPTQRHLDNILKQGDMPSEQRTFFREWIDKVKPGLVLIDEAASEDFYLEVVNLHLSKCYNCKKIAVWVHDKLLFPPVKTVSPPNPDLSEDIVNDFEEARSIADYSPRGAAALLRLCVQKLCKQLGETGKSIDADIASLVAKGLNPLIQKSLDIVRVIGNEAVHPGTLDLKDDRDTALQLFDIVNSICDQMISHPKRVENIYSKLPTHKLEAISRRDSKAK